MLHDIPTLLYYAPNLFITHWAFIYFEFAPYNKLENQSKHLVLNQFNDTYIAEPRCIFTSRGLVIVEYCGVDANCYELRGTVYLKVSIVFFKAAFFI